jgi:hypothetical protein
MNNHFTKRQTDFTHYSENSFLTGSSITHRQDILEGERQLSLSLLTQFRDSKLEISFPGLGDKKSDRRQRIMTGELGFS